jgi:Protein of unknown function (DUF3618)
MESQSEQFEREAEETRWQLAGTFEELRDRMTPGRVVDQVVDYTRDGRRPSSCAISSGKSGKIRCRSF